MSMEKRVIEARVIPNEFWKYYDLYRRKVITLIEFSKKTGLSPSQLKGYLQLI